MKTIKLVDRVGSFAENKDKAKKLRTEELMPLLKMGEDITLDFNGIDAATQSFVHALISDLFRMHGEEILNRVTFKNCNETVKKIISIVSDYMQEAD